MWTVPVRLPMMPTIMMPVRPTLEAATAGAAGVPTRVVLVTGGTKGIGREIAQAFLAQGCEVVVCARNAPATLPAAAGREALRTWGCCAHCLWCWPGTCC